MTATTTERMVQQPVVCLRIVRGLHLRAERKCAPGDMVLVGTADDCDLILSDADVKPHHCFLSLGETWTARALEGALDIDGRSIPPGDSTALRPFDVLGFGGAALAVGENTDPRWDDLVAPPVAEPVRTAALRGRSRVLLVALGLSVCVATAIAAATLQPTTEIAPPSPRAVLETSVRDVALEHARIDQDAKGKLRVSGLAGDEHSIERLRSDLEARGVVADVDVRSGRDLANDVGEVLRLSDLRADTDYRGNGEVGISGHFGDGKQLDAVLASRALRDVKGLTKVAVVNLDGGRKVEPAPTLAEDARRIVVAVGGTDPYIVMGDGSRYFAGAELPCGGRLHAVDGQDVYVMTGETVRALDCTGAIVSRAITEDMRVEPSPAAGDAAEGEGDETQQGRTDTGGQAAAVSAQRTAPPEEG